jgi:hypothetical protein
VALDLVQPSDPGQCSVGAFRVSGLGLVELSPRVRHATHFHDASRMNLIVELAGLHPAHPNPLP